MSFPIISEHDISDLIHSRLSTSPHTSQNARHRYATHFGPLNQQVTLQNHTLVLLDAPGLVEEDYRRVALNKQYSEWEPISGGPIELVKSISPGQR